jgi:hypothetical protein
MKIIVCALFIAFIASVSSTCEFRGVHVTLGDYFTVSSNDHIYTLGWQSRSPCDLKKVSLRLFIHSQLEPIIIGKPYERRYTAPKTSKVDYDRYFYFIYIHKNDLKESICQFNYQLFQESNESEEFLFDSQLYCKKEYKFYILGENDEDRLGLLALESLYKSEYDLLLMPGQYVNFYQTQNGVLSDKYFQTLQPLLTKKPYLILPGQKERFDDYKMFNSRFRMPGCDINDLNCDIYHIIDDNFSIVVINMERGLYNRKINRMDNVRETEKILRFLNTNEAHKDKWLFVMTNQPLYSSSNNGVYPSNVILFYQKPYDDLFEKFQVNMMMTSSKKYFDQVHNVFNYSIRSDSNRSYLIAGSAGSKLFYLTSAVEKTPLSASVISNTQGLVQISVFDTYFKSEFLQVPMMVTLDVNYTEKFAIANDWIYLLAGFCVVAIVLGLMQVIDGQKMGKFLSNAFNKKKEEEKKDNTGLKSPLTEHA